MFRFVKKKQYDMAANIDEVYRLLKYRATKAGYNGNISPDEFNLIWPRAEQRHFNAKYKQYELSQEIGESLMPFKTDPLTITVDSQGKYTKPIDILHIDSMRVPYLTIQSEVDRFSDDRLANKLSSSYDAPNKQFPIYVEYATYLQFYPIDLGNAILVYLKELVPSKWGYILNSKNRPVYNPTMSIQPKWNDNDIDEICYMVLSDLAINMRDQQLDQFAERKIQTDI